MRYLLLLVAGWCVLGQTKDAASATVTVAIVDGWGMPLADSLIRSFKDEQGQDWRGAFVPVKSLSSTTVL